MTDRRAILQTCLLATLLMMLGISVVPVASADDTDSLRAAIAAARSASCGPTRSDPLLDQVAAQVNDSTDSYLNFTARAVPIEDPLPYVNDLGYVGATKARLLVGAATTPGASIKAALLQGAVPTATNPAALPDCSLNAYGVATKYNAKKGVVLVAAVLVG